MEPADTLDVESAWAFLRQLVRESASPAPPSVPRCADAGAKQLLDLFLPICCGSRAATCVVAHLGQSLDGRIATRTGASQFITGHADVVHTHRLRALFDAVVVGARTVQFDNPRLSTRLVAGDHPVRVVLDPQRKLGPRHSVFCDGLAPTLLVTGHAQARGASAIGDAEIVAVEMHEGRFVIRALIEALRARGLSRIFVEGGGITVSEFLRAGALDRLHVAVAPVIMGSGVPVLELPPIDKLADAMRLAVRHFSLGSDVLFDCDLRAEAPRKAQ